MKLHQEKRPDICSNSVKRSLAHREQISQTNGKIGAEHQHDVDVQHDNDMKDVLHRYTTLCL